MEFEIVPASAVPLDAQARVANAAFANYVGGWADLDAQTLTRFLLLQNADLFHSRFIRVNGEVAGFGYITRTANVVRLSGMAIIPAARGTGAAAHLLEALCSEAVENGDVAMLLEVIEQNPRAHALYRRHGFRELTRLTSWRRTGGAAVETNAGVTLQELPVLEALRMPSAREYPDIPWQISRHAVAKVPHARAFRADGVCIFISDPEAQPVRIYGFLAPSAEPAQIVRALNALVAQFASADFFAPALWPEQLSIEIFAPAAFKREQLSQFLMRRDFAR